MTTRYIVAVYLHDRAYGGPEEGGWYYPCGELVRVMGVFGHEEMADDYAQRLENRLASTLNKDRRSINSVLSEGQYGAFVFEDFVPQSFPSELPHYE